MPMRTIEQGIQRGSLSTKSGLLSTSAEPANRVPALARNERTTTSVWLPGVALSPESRIVLLNVSMLHAQKNAIPK